MIIYGGITVFKGFIDDGFDLTGIEDYPEYVVLSAGIRKRNLLDTSEKYLVDNTVSLMKKHGCRITEDEIKDEMVVRYEAEQGQFDLTSSVNAFDFIMEILYNFLQLKEINDAVTLLNSSGDVIDIDVIQEENIRLSKLKQYTDNEEVIANISSVAFNQEELADLYDDFSPATKKQSDLLSSKMKEAGYEWDDKKKKLRKI